jgi:hypothetical protein
LVTVIIVQKTARRDTAGNARCCSQSLIVGEAALCTLIVPMPQAVPECIGFFESAPQAERV